MTREEVITFLQWYVNNASISSKGFNEACQMAISALRPVSRERVEQARWIKIYENGEPAIEQHQTGVACSRGAGVYRHRS